MVWCSGKGAVLSFTISTVDETGSTNADMLALAASGVEEGSWLRAKRQTSGKGRMGRHWESPEGNFYGSTIIHLQPGDPPASTLAFVASVALLEVLKTVAPALTFSLKWPNDVLSARAKLSGILLERANDSIVLGIGVNLVDHPERLDRPVGSLVSLGATAPDPEQFAERLAAHFAFWLGRWRDDGVGSVVGTWERYAHPKGTELSVNLPDGEALRGSYDGLNNDGALRLCLPDGAIRAIHAADVFLV